jgi:hypothetical protein
VLLDVRRHSGLGDRLGKLRDLLGPLAVLAQLLTDLAHLLAQQNLLLAVVECFLGLLLDLPRKLEHLDPPGEQVGDALETVLELGRLQELLFVRNLDIEEARDHVGEHRRRLDRLDAVGELRGRLRQQRYRLHGLLLQVKRPGAGVGKELDPRHEERESAHLVEHPEATLALAHEVMRAVGGGEVTHDGGHGPHAM